MRRASSALSSLLLLFLLSGCWNRVELNELSVVMATAVDVEDNHWVTTFQVVIPQSIAAQSGTGSQGQSPVSVFSTKGDTLSAAIQRISLESSRTPFFAHNRVLIISEKAAREKGVSQIVDFYLRDGETRETVDVLLSKGNARNILEMLNPQEKIPANAIDRIIYETEKQLSLERRIKLSEFAAMLATPSRNAFAPQISIAGKQGPEITVDELKRMRQKGVVKIGDIGVFRGDKLAYWINREESIGIAWLTNHIENSVVSFPCSDQGDKGEKSTFLVDRATTKIKPDLSGDTILIKAAIDAKGILNETGCNVEMSKPESIAKLESLIKKEIQKDIATAWETAREKKTDVFGFSEIIRIHNPRKWKRLEPTWYDKLPEVKLETDVRVKVRRTGMINDSFSSIVKE